MTDLVVLDSDDTVVGRYRSPVGASKAIADAIDADWRYVRERLFIGEAPVVGLSLNGYWVDTADQVEPL